MRRYFTIKTGVLFLILIVVATSLIGCGKGGIPDVSDAYKTTPVTLRINFASDVASARIFMSLLSTLEQEKLNNLSHNQTITINVPIVRGYEGMIPSYVDTSGKSWDGGVMHLRSHHRVINFGPGGNISLE